jgi:hypothetical protein
MPKNSQPGQLEYNGLAFRMKPKGLSGVQTSPGEVNNTEVEHDRT